MKRITVAAITAFVAIAFPFAVFAQHDHGMHAMPKAKPKPKVMATANLDDRIFVTYEQAREALITESLPKLRKAAKHIGASARQADEQKLSELAETLEKAPDIKAARVAFAALSDGAIKYRETRCCGDKPVVVYCSMKKQSWLQPAGEIGNPYVDASMRKCGEIMEQ
jgi:hypothetical protein